jgi:hypothetical protein
VNVITKWIIAPFTAAALMLTLGPVVRYGGSAVSAAPKPMGTDPACQGGLPLFALANVGGLEGQSNGAAVYAVHFNNLIACATYFQLQSYGTGASAACALVDLTDGTLVVQFSPQAVIDDTETGHTTTPISNTNCQPTS